MMDRNHNTRTKEAPSPKRGTGKSGRIHCGGSKSREKEGYEAWDIRRDVDYTRKIKKVEYQIQQKKGGRRRRITKRDNRDDWNKVEGNFERFEN